MQFLEEKRTKFYYKNILYKDVLLFYRVAGLQMPSEQVFQRWCVWESCLYKVLW